MKIIRIGTRESQLAVWQAMHAKEQLTRVGYEAELVLIKSEGDIDVTTPLYEMGVQGIFTRSLDMALLNKKIDVAVHSMKDVPTQLATGITQAAVLPRASYKDILVYNGERQAIKDMLAFPVPDTAQPFTVATSSIRRKAQWLYRYPHHRVEVLRGNVNTRLIKVNESDWNGGIFAAAGLERIDRRPENSLELAWMLPAPAQGAIMLVCREEDDLCKQACSKLNDADTEICTKFERDFLRELLGGCSTPISALAEIKDDKVLFRGNILSPDGKEKADIEIIFDLDSTMNDHGIQAARQLLKSGGDKIVEGIKHA